MKKKKTQEVLTSLICVIDTFITRFKKRSLLHYSSDQQSQTAGIISRGHIADKPAVFIPRTEGPGVPLHHEFLT